MPILYTTGCPKCKVLIKKLESKGIKYEVFDDVNKMIEKGFTNMPMFEIDGNVMNFGEAIKWINERN